jgi:hypothetical protein
MSLTSFAGALGGIAVALLITALIWFFLLRKKSTNQGKVTLERKLPQAEETLLSPGPLTPPMITRVSPTRAISGIPSHLT